MSHINSTQPKQHQITITNSTLSNTSCPTHNARTTKLHYSSTHPLFSSPLHPPPSATLPPPHHNRQPAHDLLLPARAHRLRDRRRRLLPARRPDLQAQRLREASTGTAPWSVSSLPASRTFRAHPLSRSLQSVTASPALEVLPMDSRGSCTAPDCACATFVGSAHARQVVHVRDARVLALVLTRRLQRPARDDEPCSTCRHPWFSHASLPPTTRVITSHGPVPTGYCRRTHCGGFFHVRQPLVRVPRNHGSHLLSLCHRLRHSRVVRALHWLPNTLTWLDPLWSECSIERRHGRVPDHAQQSLDRVDWS